MRCGIVLYMGQKILHFMAPDAQLRALTSELTARGFRVRPSRRLSGGIDVRVRDGEVDTAEVASIVSSVAPDAKEGPAGTPTQTIVGYREG